MKDVLQKDIRRLYGDLAWTWPIISPVGDYEEEGELFARIIKEESRGPVKTLLNLGCGGGHVDFYLKRHFQVTSADISEPMLSLARDLNPEVAYMAGDMRSIRVGQLFDAVVIHDAINYMLTVDDLRAAFRTAYEHLSPGGVFITCVEMVPGAFPQNETKATPRSRGDVEIVFIENYYDPDPGDTTYECVFVYLIRRRGQLTVEMDRHLGGIFPLETWQNVLQQVGFEVRRRKFEHSEFESDRHYPMLIGEKPPVETV